MTSPPYPSAQGWFVNVLHELGIMFYDESFAWTVAMTPKSRDCWVKLPDGTYTVNEEWRMKGLVILPGLQDRTSYRFDEDISIGVSHRLDFMRDPDSKVIVVVRDPRDALYSAVWRNPVHTARMESMGNENGLHAYLTMPAGEIITRHETLVYAPLFSQLQFWMFYMGYCELMSRSANVKIFRMEDSKKDPVGTVHALLQFLGKRRSDEQIARAIELSSVERFRIEKVPEYVDHYFKDKKPIGNARRGKPEEWRERHFPSERRLYEGYPAAFLKHFGYDTDGLSCDVSINDLFETEDQRMARFRQWIVEEENLANLKMPNIQDSIRADAARLACLWTMEFTKGGPSSSHYSLSTFAYAGRFLELCAKFDPHDQATLVRALYTAYQDFAIPEITAITPVMKRLLHP